MEGGFIYLDLGAVWRINGGITLLIRTDVYDILTDANTPASFINNGDLVVYSELNSYTKFITMNTVDLYPEAKLRLRGGGSISGDIVKTGGVDDLPAAVEFLQGTFTFEENGPFKVTGIIDLLFEGNSVFANLRGDFLYSGLFTVLLGPGSSLTAYPDTVFASDSKIDIQSGIMKVAYVLDKTLLIPDVYLTSALSYLKLEKQATCTITKMEISDGGIFQAADLAVAEITTLNHLNGLVTGQASEIFVDTYNWKNGSQEGFYGKTIVSTLNFNGDGVRRIYDREVIVRAGTAYLNDGDIKLDTTGEFVIEDGSNFYIQNTNSSKLSAVDCTTCQFVFNGVILKTTDANVTIEDAIIIATKSLLLNDGKLILDGDLSTLGLIQLNQQAEIIVNTGTLNVTQGDLISDGSVLVLGGELNLFSKLSVNDGYLNVSGGELNLWSGAHVDNMQNPLYLLENGVINAMSEAVTTKTIENLIIYDTTTVVNSYGELQIDKLWFRDGSMNIIGSVEVTFSALFNKGTIYGGGVLNIACESTLSLSTFTVTSTIVSFNRKVSFNSGIFYLEGTSIATAVKDVAINCSTGICHLKTDLDSLLNTQQNFTVFADVGAIVKLENFNSSNVFYMIDGEVQFLERLIMSSTAYFMNGLATFWNSLPIEFDDSLTTNIYNVTMKMAQTTYSLPLAGQFILHQPFEWKYGIINLKNNLRITGENFTFVPDTASDTHLNMDVGVTASIENLNLMASQSSDIKGTLNVDNLYIADNAELTTSSTDAIVNIENYVSGTNAKFTEIYAIIENLVAFDDVTFSNNVIEVSNSFESNSHNFVLDSATIIFNSDFANEINSNFNVSSSGTGNVTVSGEVTLSATVFIDVLEITNKLNVSSGILTVTESLVNNGLLYVSEGAQFNVDAVVEFGNSGQTVIDGTLILTDVSTFKGTLTVGSTGVIEFLSDSNIYPTAQFVLSGAADLLVKATKKMTTTGCDGTNYVTLPKLTLESTAILQVDCPTKIVEKLSILDAFVVLNDELTINKELQWNTNSDISGNNELVLMKDFTVNDVFYLKSPIRMATGKTFNVSLAGELLITDYGSVSSNLPVYVDGILNTTLPQYSSCSINTVYVSGGNLNVFAPLYTSNFRITSGVATIQEPLYVSTKLELVGGEVTGSSYIKGAFTFTVEGKASVLVSLPLWLESGATATILDGTLRCANAFELKADVDTPLALKHTDAVLTFELRADISPYSVAEILLREGTIIPYHKVNVTQFNSQGGVLELTNDINIVNGDISGITIKGNKTLNVETLLLWKGGRIKDDVILDIQGNMKVQGNLRFEDNITINVYGYFTPLIGDITVPPNMIANMIVHPSGEILFSSGASTFTFGCDISSDCYLENNGKFTMDVARKFTLLWSLNNTNTFNCSNGDIVFATSTISSGNITINGDAELVLPAYNHNITTEGSLSGTGTVILESGYLYIEGALGLSSSIGLNLKGGILWFGNTMSCPGAVSLSGGTIKFEDRSDGNVYHIGSINMLGATAEVETLDASLVIDNNLQIMNGIIEVKEPLYIGNLLTMNGGKISGDGFIHTKSLEWTNGVLSAATLNITQDFTLTGSINLKLNPVLNMHEGVFAIEDGVIISDGTATIYIREAASLKFAHPTVQTLYGSSNEIIVDGTVIVDGSYETHLEWGFTINNGMSCKSGLLILESNVLLSGNIEVNTSCELRIDTSASNLLFDNNVNLFGNGLVSVYEADITISGEISLLNPELGFVLNDTLARVVVESTNISSQITVNAGILTLPTGTVTAKSWTFNGGRVQFADYNPITLTIDNLQIASAVLFELPENSIIYVNNNYEQYISLDIALKIYVLDNAVATISSNTLDGPIFYVNGTLNLPGNKFIVMSSSSIEVRSQGIVNSGDDFELVVDASHCFILKGTLVTSGSCILSNFYGYSGSNVNITSGSLTFTDEATIKGSLNGNDSTVFIPNGKFIFEDAHFYNITLNPYLSSSIVEFANCSSIDTDVVVQSGSVYVTSSFIDCTATDPYFEINGGTVTFEDDPSSVNQTIGSIRVANGILGLSDDFDVKGSMTLVGGQVQGVGQIFADNFVWNGGYLSIGANVTVQTTLDITLSEEGVVLEGLSFISYGNCYWRQGDIQATTGSFINYGTFELLSDSSFTSNAGHFGFINEGLLKKVVAGTTTLGGISNNGIIDIAGGIVAFETLSDLSSGELRLNNGGELRYSGGSHDLFSDVLGDGNGIISVDGENTILNIKGQLTVKEIKVDDGTVTLEHDDSKIVADTISLVINSGSLTIYPEPISNNPATFKELILNNGYVYAENKTKLSTVTLNGGYLTVNGEIETSGDIIFDGGRLVGTGTINGDCTGIVRKTLTKITLSDFRCSNGLVVEDNSDLILDVPFGMPSALLDVKSGVAKFMRPTDGSTYTYIVNNINIHENSGIEVSEGAVIVAQNVTLIGSSSQVTNYGNTTIDYLNATYGVIKSDDLLTLNKLDWGNEGYMTGYGSVVVKSGEIFGAVAKELKSNINLTIDGNVVWKDGNIIQDDCSSIFVNPSANLTINGAIENEIIGSCPTMTNYGELYIDPVGDVTLNELNNYGNLTLTAHSLTLGGDSIHTRTENINGKLILGSGFHVFSGEHVDLTVTQPIELQGTMNIKDAQMSCSQGFDFKSGALSLDNATFHNPVDILTIENGRLEFVEGGTSYIDQVQLSASGTIVLSDKTNGTVGKCYLDDGIVKGEGILQCNNFTWTQTNITGDSSVQTPGEINLVGAGPRFVSDNAVLSLNSTRSIGNTGIKISDDAKLAIGIGAVISLTETDAQFGVSDNGKILIEGTLRKDTAGSLLLPASEISGELIVTDGTVQLDEHSIISGKISVGGSATQLLLTGSEHKILTGGQFNVIASVPLVLQSTLKPTFGIDLETVEIHNGGKISYPTSLVSTVNKLTLKAGAAIESTGGSRTNLTVSDITVEGTVSLSRMYLNIDGLSCSLQAGNFNLLSGSVITILKDSVCTVTNTIYISGVGSMVNYGELVVNTNGLFGNYIALSNYGNMTVKANSQLIFYDGSDFTNAGKLTNEGNITLGADDVVFTSASETKSSNGFIHLESDSVKLQGNFILNGGEFTISAGTVKILDNTTITNPSVPLYVTISCPVISRELSTYEIQDSVRWRSFCQGGLSFVVENRTDSTYWPTIDYLRMNSGVVTISHNMSFPKLEIINQGILFLPLVDVVLNQTGLTYVRTGGYHVGYGDIDIDHGYCVPDECECNYGFDGLDCLTNCASITSPTVCASKPFCGYCGTDGVCMTVDSSGQPITGTCPDFYYNTDPVVDTCEGVLMMPDDVAELKNTAITFKATESNAFDFTVSYDYIRGGVSLILDFEEYDVTRKFNEPNNCENRLYSAVIGGTVEDFKTSAPHASVERALGGNYRSYPPMPSVWKVTNDSCNSLTYYGKFSLKDLSVCRGSDLSSLLSYHLHNNTPIISYYGSVYFSVVQIGDSLTDNPTVLYKTKKTFTNDFTLGLKNVYYGTCDLNDTNCNICYNARGCSFPVLVETTKLKVTESHGYFNIYFRMRVTVKSIFALANPSILTDPFHSSNGENNITITAVVDDYLPAYIQDFIVESNVTDVTDPLTFANSFRYSFDLLNCETDSECVKDEEKRVHILHEIGETYNVIEDADLDSAVNTIFSPSILTATAKITEEEALTGFMGPFEYESIVYVRSYVNLVPLINSNYITTSSSYTLSINSASYCFSSSVPVWNPDEGSYGCNDIDDATVFIKYGVEKPNATNELEVGFNKLTLDSDTLNFDSSGGDFQIIAAGFWFSAPKLSFDRTGYLHVSLNVTSGTEVTEFNTIRPFNIEGKELRTYVVVEEQIPTWVWFAGIGGPLLLIGIIVTIIICRRKAKEQKLKEEEENKIIVTKDHPAVKAIGALALTLGAVMVNRDRVSSESSASAMRKRLDEKLQEKETKNKLGDPRLRKLYESTGNLPMLDLDEEDDLIDGNIDEFNNMLNLSSDEESDEDVMVSVSRPTSSRKAERNAPVVPKRDSRALVAALLNTVGGSVNLGSKNVSDDEEEDDEEVQQIVTQNEELIKSLKTLYQANEDAEMQPRQLKRIAKLMTTIAPNRLSDEDTGVVADIAEAIHANVPLVLTHNHLGVLNKYLVIDENLPNAQEVDNMAVKLANSLDFGRRSKGSDVFTLSPLEAECLVTLLNRVPVPIMTSKEANIITKLSRSLYAGVTISLEVKDVDSVLDLIHKAKKPSYLPTDPAINKMIEHLEDNAKAKRKVILSPVEVERIAMVVARMHINNLKPKQAAVTIEIINARSSGAPFPLGAKKAWRLAVVLKKVIEMFEKEPANLITVSGDPEVLNSKMKAFDPTKRVLAEILMQPTDNVEEKKAETVDPKDEWLTSLNTSLIRNSLLTFEVHELERLIELFKKLKLSEASEKETTLLQKIISSNNEKSPCMLSNQEIQTLIKILRNSSVSDEAKQIILTNHWEIPESIDKEDFGSIIRLLETVVSNQLSPAEIDVIELMFARFFANQPGDVNFTLRQCQTISKLLDQASRGISDFIEQLRNEVHISSSVSIGPSAIQFILKFTSSIPDTSLDEIEKAILMKMKNAADSNNSVKLNSNQSNVIISLLQDISSPRRLIAPDSIETQHVISPEEAGRLFNIISNLDGKGIGRGDDDVLASMNQSHQKKRVLYLQENVLKRFEKLLADAQAPIQEIFDEYSTKGDHFVIPVSKIEKIRHQLKHLPTSVMDVAEKALMSRFVQAGKSTLPLSAEEVITFMRILQKLLEPLALTESITNVDTDNVFPKLLAPKTDADLLGYQLRNPLISEILAELFFAIESQQYPYNIVTAKLRILTQVMGASFKSDYSNEILALIRATEEAFTSHIPLHLDEEQCKILHNFLMKNNVRFFTTS
eukprot:TRINITY_DN3302_c0_g1_i1.p1 TRINITY_DN3302_c0_g1~~TRINITY_DN3302_c0_g1_i1.p1  ORF type:complete len:5663 (+),score=1800.79 TRINITY_DN3302_c0_g1_i1:2308-16989(+)